MSVAKRRSPRRAAQSKARRSEPDEDVSPADSGDEEQVSGGTEHSPDDSNYSDEESVTSRSKEEGGEEDDEVEDVQDNAKAFYQPRSQGKDWCYQITILRLRICCVTTDRANPNAM